MMSMNRKRRQRGAALLILVTLAGLGTATLLISAFSRVNVDLGRERRTLLALAQAKDALLGFALTHGRLPRPAASGVDGRENGVPCVSEQHCTGLIPWVTLGIESIDGWGKVLRYSVTPGFANAPIQPGTLAASKTVLDRDSNGLPYYLVGQPGCGPNTQCVPAVLFSSGKNNHRAFDELHNQHASQDFMRRAATGEPAAHGGPFDDLLNWITMSTLVDRMRAAGALR
jgi:hypothetical protein